MKTKFIAPNGVEVEGIVLYSSPIAATNGIQDMIQMMSIITNYIFNEDYNINGEYYNK